MQAPLGMELTPAQLSLLTRDLLIASKHFVQLSKDFMLISATLRDVLDSAHLYKVRSLVTERGVEETPQETLPLSGSSSDGSGGR